MSSRVFVVEECTHDLSALWEHGEVVVLFRRRDDRPGIFEREYEDATAVALSRAQYDPDRDYIAVVGPVVPCLRAVSRAQADWGAVRVLMFNSLQRKYVAVELGRVPRAA